MWVFFPNLCFLPVSFMFCNWLWWLILDSPWILLSSSFLIFFFLYSSHHGWSFTSQVGSLLSAQGSQLPRTPLPVILDSDSMDYNCIIQSLSVNNLNQIQGIEVWLLEAGSLGLNPSSSLIRCALCTKCKPFLCLSCLTCKIMTNSIYLIESCHED